MSVEEPTPNPRRRNMQANRRRDTSPELEIRKRLHRYGLRYRCDLRVDLPEGRVRPDVVFTRARVAVFVDGCFWHSCPLHGAEPRKNASYWSPKLRRTRERDLADSAALGEAGWSVIRVWEHEDPNEVSNRVIDAVRDRVAERSATRQKGQRGLKGIELRARAVPDWSWSNYDATR